jgi:hypothetical protein
MKSTNLTKQIGGAILGLVMLVAIGVMSSTTAQAQWQQWPSSRDRDYGRNRDDRNRRGNGGFQVARDRGYQAGISTGQSDSQRGQNFSPQRSHYYRNATDGYDRYYGNKEAYKQAYRDAFVRGYEDGFRRYGGNNRGNNGRWRNGRWFPW